MMRKLVFLYIYFATTLVWAKPSSFEEAKKTGEEVSAKYSWERPGLNLVISGHGVLTSNLVRSQVPGTNSKIPVGRNALLEKAYAQPLGNDVLIAYETSDGESGKGGICRVETSTLSIRWCQRIPGFNIFGALDASKNIFVSAIGFVGRINSENGKYIWKNSGLHDGDGAINLLCDMDEQGKNISFEASSGIQHTAARRVYLDKATGEILSFSPPFSVASFCQ